MVSITSNFQFEPRLHEAARMALPHIFDSTWADPSKIGADSKSAAILLNEAKETFASHLGVRSDELSFIGDFALGFHLGISGLINSDSRLIFSNIDQQAIFAIAAEHQNLQVNCQPSGQLDFTQVGDLKASDVISYQIANRETGIMQKPSPKETNNLFVDATASGTRIALPENWATALWDSRSWAGPAGLAIFARSKLADWKNPLPHLNSVGDPNSPALSLIVASALAIDSWVADEKNLAAKIAEINSRIRNFLSENIEDCDLTPGGLDHLLSASFLYINAEQLVTKLGDAGFAVDSGSACSSTNMEPSHVLAAMGLLTQGNIRLTIHHATTFEEVDAFLATLKAIVEELRG